jgi:hypothetical protein
MKNSKVKMQSLPSHTAELTEVSTNQSNAAALNRGARRIERFSKISDDIAQSDHWMRNEPIPFGLELFPGEEWFLRYADLFYPVAKGGPLYIDTPMSLTEIRYCERKIEAYRTKGVRYTYIKANEDASEASMRLDVDLPRGINS